MSTQYSILHSHSATNQVPLGCTVQYNPSSFTCYPVQYSTEPSLYTPSCFVGIQYSIPNFHCSTLNQPVSPGCTVQYNLTLFIFSPVQYSTEPTTLTLLWFMGVQCSTQFSLLHFHPSTNLLPLGCTVQYNPSPSPAIRYSTVRDLACTLPSCFIGIQYSIPHFLGSTLNQPLSPGCTVQYNLPLFIFSPVQYSTVWNQPRSLPSCLWVYSIV